MCLIYPDNRLPASPLFLPVKLNIHLGMKSKVIIFEVGLKNISGCEFAPKGTKRALQSRSPLLLMTPFLLFSIITKPAEDISHPIHPVLIHLGLPEFLLVPMGERLFEVASEEWDASPAVTLE